MSSLIFLDDAQAFVATDTLAVPPDGSRFRFTSKALYLPRHLRSIIAGTGAGGFATRSCATVNDRFVVRDIDNLDQHAPRVLGETWPEFRREHQAPDPLLTTVYRIGISEETGNVRA
jgi:hypothetical protein